MSYGAYLRELLRPLRIYGLEGTANGGELEPQGTLSPEELEQALARFFDRPVPAVPYLLEHW